MYICPPGDDDIYETPMDVPPEIQTTEWQLMTDTASQQFLGFALTWIPVEDATGYEIVASVGDQENFTHQTETMEASVLVGFSLPVTDTMHYFKLRAVVETLNASTGVYEAQYGPWGPVAMRKVPSQASHTSHTPMPLSTIKPDFGLFPV